MSNLLIAVDAGHGGWDNGATFEGRLEKDDNLRLALAVQEEMEGQGLNVLMTRDSDVYVSLQDRVQMANEANADLFVSLHRNSYFEQTPWANGVSNFIYLTEPEETVGRAARLVLDRVVEAGVQADRGVFRGNYYVLRRTAMPAMLLEMGYIINERDNELFDEKLYDYAIAITKGVMDYFGLTYQTPTPEPPPGETPPPATLNPVAQAQQAVNLRFNYGMPVSGRFNQAAQQAMILMLQRVLNSDFGLNLPLTGVLDAATVAAIPNIREGQRGNVVFVLQALLQMRCYPPGPLDGVFGPQTRHAVQMFQRDNFLVANGVAGPRTITELFRI